MASWIGSFVVVVVVENLRLRFSTEPIVLPVMQVQLESLIKSLHRPACMAGETAARLL